MRITELIEKLEVLKREGGDLPVAILTDTPDGLFHFDYSPAIEVVGVPDPNGYTQEEELVCAVAWGETLNEDDAPEPPSAEPVRKPLRIIKGRDEL